MENTGMGEPSALLDDLLRGFRCLLSSNAQVQLLLHDHNYRQQSFLSNIIAAKKLVDSNEQAMYRLPSDARELVARWESTPQLKIWVRFQARVQELFNRYGRFLDFDTDFSERIFERGYLLMAVEDLSKYNQRLLRLLYRLVYNWQLQKKYETAAMYEQRMYMGRNSHNEPYEMLMAHQQLIEYTKHTVVGSYASATVHELFDNLELQYHKPPSYNFDWMVRCMLKRNEPQQYVISNYEAEYLAYRRKDKRPFFKSSLRYHQTVFNKTMTLSLLKEFYDSCSANFVHTANENQKRLSKETRQSGVSYLNLIQSFDFPSPQKNAKDPHNYTYQPEARKHTETPKLRPKKKYQINEKEAAIKGKKYAIRAPPKRTGTTAIHTTRTHNRVNSNEYNLPPKDFARELTHNNKSCYVNSKFLRKGEPRSKAVLTISNIELERKQAIPHSFCRPHLYINQWYKTNQVKYVQLVNGPHGWYRPAAAKKQLEVVVFHRKNLHLANFKPKKQIIEEL